MPKKIIKILFLVCIQCEYFFVCDTGHNCKRNVGTSRYMYSFQKQSTTQFIQFVHIALTLQIFT